MHRIIYLDGDATQPVIRPGRTAVIAHVVNSEGGWGAGFSGALSRRWLAPEHEYRQWYAKQKDWEMGNVQTVPVTPTIAVANMLCQVGYKSEQNPTPLSYPALAIAWPEVLAYAEERRANVHFPKIGCGLAGGDWDIVSEIIARDVPEGIELFCYRVLSRK